MSSQVIHVVKWQDFLLLRLNNIWLHVYATFSLFIHLSMDISCLLWILCWNEHEIADVSSRNWFYVFGYIPRSENWWIIWISYFQLNFHFTGAFFEESDCISLHSHQIFAFPVNVFAVTIYIFYIVYPITNYCSYILNTAFLTFTLKLCVPATTITILVYP